MYRELIREIKLHEYWTRNSSLIVICLKQLILLMNKEAAQ